MDNKWGPRGTGKATPAHAKESFSIRTRTQLRRSKSVSELQKLQSQQAANRRPVIDRNGANYPRVHPLLPPPNTLKENKSSVRNTVGPTLARKRVAPPASAPQASAKKMRPIPNATAPPKTVVSKKIPPYDFKARYNDLLEKHKSMKATYLDLKNSQDERDEDLIELRAEREFLTERVKCLESTIGSNESLISKLSDNLKVTTDSLNAVTNECEMVNQDNYRLNEELSRAETELDETKQKLQDITARHSRSEKINKQQEQVISKQAEDIEILQENTLRLEWERRSLHNKLQDLKGNIRVIFRVRPPLAEGRTVAMMSFPDACTLEMERFEANRRLTKYDFKFDRVFGPSSSQEDIWEEVSCLIQSALDGYNACIFAYGQTGSGKTYTMEGSLADLGIIPRCCKMIFDSINILSKSGWKYTVHASFLEIYNEHLYDLLEPTRDPRDFEIRMTDAKGSDVYVTNLSEQEVKSADELLILASRAQMNRQTAATSANERSSRSHSVTRVRLIATHAAKALTLSSRICLVDLAGSESAKNTQRLKETKNINRSLSELGQVILALQQKQEHVPFRNSKLTRLLEPQLGGAAKALLVAAAAPYEDCCQESLSTLRFATQVGHCSTAAARRNLALAQPTMVQPKDS
ncbi:protein claret segregational-like [Arctopsyche grandis]|uniref:protein claret segregational-like n=1 Tax=Arctopsyche grandis TaxID=121162 RepID=UPI00406D7EAF